VVKPEWGIKRHCQACGVNFYDLKRSPIVCPKCSEVLDPEAFTRSRRSLAPVEKKTAGTAKKKAAGPLAKTDDKTNDMLSAAESVDEEGEEKVYVPPEELEAEHNFEDGGFEDDGEEAAEEKSDGPAEEGAVEAEAQAETKPAPKKKTKPKPVAKQKTGTKNPPSAKGKKA